MVTWALNLFDRLHLGHEVMIDRLAEMPDPIVGVTDGELVGRGLELEKLIQPPEIRVKRLTEYLVRSRLSDIIDVRHVAIVEDLLTIKEPVTFMMYEGPCCTEIESGAIEKRRNSLGVSDNIEYLKPVRAHDGDKIASARIRRGEIDRQGRRLRRTHEKPRRLQFEGRAGLKTPKGDVYNIKDGKPEERVVQRIETESPEVVITVGDVVTATVLEQGYTPRVMIVDGITKRGLFDREFTAENEYQIYNPAAAIYPEAWSTIDTAIHEGKPTLVLVDGEEDLLGFPVVLLAPEDSVMLYGQPDVGIVWVPITKQNKKLARDLLKQMPIIK
ncbi:MAG: DUF359 domain-containing protein [Candidatus Thorarchaeota archaeon]|nr:DUF359 domain-containing protein [Candidatus Thorarchaeota archaeon]